MSFLKDILGGAGAAGAVGGAAAPAAAPVNPMASGLGRLIGADPSRVSEVAGRIGTGMNQIATAGGAQPGYAPPTAQPVQTAPQEGDPNNHLQLLDPQVLQGLIARFRPTGQQGAL